MVRIDDQKCDPDITASACGVEGSKRLNLVTMLPPEQLEKVQALFLTENIISDFSQMGNALELRAVTALNVSTGIQTKCMDTNMSHLKELKLILDCMNAFHTAWKVRGQYDSQKINQKTPASSPD